MRFVIDAQLPPALARMLVGLGHTAEHVADIGLRDADDSPIWEYALKKEAVILTKDEDFAHRQGQSRIAPILVLVRIGNTSRRALLEWIEPLIPQIVDLIEKGDRIIEVR